MRITKIMGVRLDRPKTEAGEERPTRRWARACRARFLIGCLLVAAATGATANALEETCLVPEICYGDGETGDPAACEAGSVGQQYQARSSVSLYPGAGVGAVRAACEHGCYDGFEYSYVLIGGVGPNAFLSWSATQDHSSGEARSCTLSYCGSSGCAQISEECPPDAFAQSCGQVRAGASS